MQFPAIESINNTIFQSATRFNEPLDIGIKKLGKELEKQGFLKLPASERQVQFKKLAMDLAAKNNIKSPEIWWEGLIYVLKKVPNSVSQDDKPLSQNTYNEFKFLGDIIESSIGGNITKINNVPKKSDNFWVKFFTKYLWKIISGLLGAVLTMLIILMILEVI